MNEVPRSDPVFITIAEIAKVLGVGKTKAWQIKTTLNEELKAKGHLVPIAGKTYRRYFKERMMLS